MPSPPKDVKAIARKHTEGAIKTLVGIMNQPKATPAARVTAAQTLLDRGWGKAVQPNENHNTHEVGESFQRILEYIGQHGSMKPRDGDGS